MKRKAGGRAAAIPIIILALLTLAGCAPYGRRRSVEKLLVIQTVGVDAAGDGVALSMASGAGAGGDGAPVRLAGEGASLTLAIEDVRSRARGEALFCAHTGHLLVGEAAAARGIAELLDYAARSDELRLSVPVYILRGGTAAEAVLGAGNGSYGVCDALSSVDGELRERGDGRLTSAAELLRETARSGSCLVCALELRRSAEDDRSLPDAQETPLTVAPAGFAVLKDGKLCGFLDRGQAQAANLLAGQTGPCELALDGATLTLTDGRCRLRAQRGKDGTLTGLLVEAELGALLAEGEGRADELQRAAELRLAERLRTTLQLSKQWEADFLGLGARLALLAPGAFEEADFLSLWTGLPVTVSVSVRLRGSGDLEGGG